MTAAMTLRDLEGQSYSILADASQVIVRVREQSSLALRHFQILRLLRTLAPNTRKLLMRMREPDTVSVLERAEPTEIKPLAEAVRKLQTMRDEVVRDLHALDGRTGYWRKLYRPLARDLERQNLEVAALADALEATPVLLLTKASQDAIAASLVNPPDPNTALRRALARR